MSLSYRVMIVLRGSTTPLNVREIGHILGIPPQRICSPLSKLYTYGRVEIVDVPKRIGQRGGPPMRRYRPKGAPA